MSTQVYNATGGGFKGLFPDPIIAPRDPTTSDRVSPTGAPYQVFQGWNNNLTDECWIYLGSGNWVTIASIAGAITQITGNSGIATPVGGNVNIVGNSLVTFVGSGSTLTATATAAGFPITPYVVGPVGQAGYQTVQSAINAANSAGGGIVALQPGTYTENLTLQPNIEIVSIDYRQQDFVKIVGIHTPPTSGRCGFRNLTLSSATHLISSAAAGTANIVISDCYLEVTNGYTFNLVNWTGLLELYNIDDGGSTNNGVVNNTGGAELHIDSSGAGRGSGNSMILSGILLAQNSKFACPITCQTGANVTLNSCELSRLITFSNNSVAIASNCKFSTSSAKAITMNSSGDVEIQNSIITSVATPSVIDGSGAGSLILGQVTFTENKTIATTVLVDYSAQVGLTTQYVVGPTGNYPDIQTCINSVNRLFGDKTIVVQPGLYVEDIDFTGSTFDQNIHIIGMCVHSESVIDGVTIAGNFTAPSTGQILFENVNFDATSGDVISSVAAGDANIFMRNCSSIVLSGNLINLPNWTSGGTIVIEDHLATAPSANQSFLQNTGGASVFIINSSVGTTGGAASTISGAVSIINSTVNCPVIFGTGATLTNSNSTFLGAVTCSGNSTGYFNYCSLITGASAALTMSSSAAVQLNDCIINSSNNPSIAGAGAGVLSLNGVSYLNNAALAGTLTTSKTATVDCGPIRSGGAITAATTITATLGNITATNGNFVASTAGAGIVLNSGTTSGTTTATLNGRSGQITITTPTINAGDTFTFTISNTSVTASTTQILYGLTGGTTGSAITIQSVTNSSNQSVVVVQNASAVTNSTGSLVLTFLVLN